MSQRQNNLNSLFTLSYWKKKSAAWKKKITAKSVLFSILSALLLMLFCYLLDNYKEVVASGPTRGQQVEQLKEFFHLNEDKNPEEYLFVNIAYDRVLVPVFDEQGFFPIGVINITDREKLNSFLQMVGEDYKYIILDVLLSDKYRTPVDSALAETILKTERITIADDPNISLIDKRLKAKAAYSNYFVNFRENNFVKYEFLGNNGRNLAFDIYAHMTGDSVFPQYGPFYFKDSHLQWKTLVLRMPIKLWDTEREMGKIGDYYAHKNLLLNLGADIIDGEESIKLMFKNKIIVIGNFTEDEDLHDTYIGRISGPIITVNAIEALRHNDQQIPWWLVIILFFIYFLTGLIQIAKINIASLWDKIGLKNPILRFLVTGLKFEVIFIIIAVIIYLLSGKDINTFLPPLWFTIIAAIVNRSWEQPEKSSSASQQLQSE